MTPPGTPAAPDNKLAVRHGVYSESLVNITADELRPRIMEAAPWTSDPSFSGTLQLYCQALATALLGQDHIAKVAGKRLRRRVATTKSTRQGHDPVAHRFD